MEATKDQWTGGYVDVFVTVHDNFRLDVTYSPCFAQPFSIGGFFLGHLKNRTIVLLSMRSS